MGKHYLLVNENGSDNIGDHAINEGLKSLLRLRGDTYEVAPFSTKVAKATAGKDSVQPKTLILMAKSSLFAIKPLFHLLWYLKNFSWIERSLKANSFDALIIGGGQLLLSGYAFPVAMFAWVKCAKAQGLPVYVVGVGCGERFLLSETRLYHRALTKCDQLLVREQASVEKVKRFFRAEAEFCPDLAFGLLPCNGANERSGIIVGVTDFAVFERYRHEVDAPTVGSYREYLGVWAKRTESILSNEVEAVYLASTTLKDAQCNRDLMPMLQSRLPNPVILVDGVQALESYRQLLAKSRLVFSGRMHSLILGKIEGCELEPWVISAKIKGFLKEYEQCSTSSLRDDLVQRTQLC